MCYIIVWCQIFCETPQFQYSKCISDYLSFAFNAAFEDGTSALYKSTTIHHASCVYIPVHATTPLNTANINITTAPHHLNVILQYSVYI